MEKYTVDEIKKILQQDVVDEAFVERLKSDERSGVQKLVKQYENKMQKPYKKALYENNAGKQLYKLYLDDYTIAEEVEMNKIEFLMKLNENHESVVNALSYKIDEDGVTFSTSDRKVYSKLIGSLLNEGISGSTLEFIKDEKY